METISQITQYVESHFRRMSSNTLSEGEQLHMLAGDGGVQVDVVFYLVSKSECYRFAMARPQVWLMLILSHARTQTC